MKTIPDLLVQCLRQIRHWRAARVARPTLHKLDDRLLRDIGLMRDQIDQLTFHDAEDTGRNAHRPRPILSIRPEARLS
jgi:uncharacterized protein YjiS (DUF1127 family)